MRFHFIAWLLILITFYSCNKTETKETLSKGAPAVTDTKENVFQHLKTDYPERVFAFKKMPDATVEEQVAKYETFSKLFIEYVGIYKNQPMYTPLDQENNTEAYNVLRDEMVSLKQKLKKNMTQMSKNHEDRLDSADARMNKFFPQVYNK